MRLLTLMFAVLAATIVHAIDNGVVTPLQCLEREIDHSSNSGSSNSGDSSSGSGSYSVVFTSCTTSSLPTVPSLPSALGAQGFPAPTWNETIACAAVCGSTVGLLRTKEGGVQFGLYNSSCYCVNQTADVYPSGNGSTCRDLAVFEVNFACAFLNASLGCGPGCSVTDGCCSPSPPPSPDDLPSYYRTMIQWVAIVVIVLALVEAVVYGCLRRRAIAQRQRRNRTHMRAKRDAKEITERLLGALPASPSAAQEPSISDEACSICLEPLISEESLMLPCRHNIHRSCLRDFITHQLTRSNEVTCPMCRAVVVEEDEDSTAHVRIAPAPE